MLLRKNSTIAGVRPGDTDHRFTSPEIGCTSDGRSPGSRVNDGRRSSRLPSDHRWRRLTAYSCGGSHGFSLSACTVFPFDPRREPSRAHVSDWQAGGNRAGDCLAISGRRSDRDPLDLVERDVCYKVGRVAPETGPAHRLNPTQGHSSPRSSVWNRRKSSHADHGRGRHSRGQSAKAASFYAARLDDRIY